MKRLYLIPILIFFVSMATSFLKQKSMAQTTLTKDITGEYALKGVPEMVARLKLNEDKTFQFMYIYGASDRSAQGTYVQRDNKLILHGSKATGKDFELTEQKQSGTGITVCITDPNPVLVANVVCYFINKKDTVEVVTDNKGIANTDMKDCQQIQLVHTYFPDMPTILPLQDNKNNFFTFALKPSLGEVVFDDFVLNIENNNLHCTNIYLFGWDMVELVKVK